MKVTVRKTVEVEYDVEFVEIDVPVRYGDEEMPYDFPFRSGDQWRVLVDLDGNQIVDWPGIEAEVHLKVCDGGVYRLFDIDMQQIAELEGDYVPHGVVPGSYGDYVEMTIASDGTVTNWPSNPDFSAFFKED